MISNNHRESARIYAFPSGGRSSLASKSDNKASLATMLSMVPSPNVLWGAGWYHEAAIEKSDDTLKS